MKEITRIHLAAVPYNTEVAAKKALEQYLAAIEKSLQADSDAMREIEARMVELLTERGVTGERVITTKDVKALQGQLGDPRDFADNTDEAVRGAMSPTVVSGQARKKLYRDTYHQIIGGVCAGIAAYTKVDVVIIRIAFLLLAIPSFGMTIFAYLMLLLIMPPARTAAERLEMAGEEVTLEALKLQSELQSDGPPSSAVLTILRYIVGVGLSIVALVMLAGLVATTAHYWYVLGSHDPILIMSAIAIGIAGVMAIVFCALLARALFINHYSRRLGYTVASIAIIGLLLVTASGVGMRYFTHRGTSWYRMNETTATLKSPDMAGVTGLDVRSDTPVRVVYVAGLSDAQVRAEVTYDKSLYASQPAVRLTREGEVLRVAVDNSANQPCVKKLHNCQNAISVQLSGPALSTVRVSHSNTLEYDAHVAHSVLTADLTDEAFLALTSERDIDSFVLLSDQGATANATSAPIKRATVTLRDTASSVRLATVTSLQATVPEACAANTLGATLTIGHATTASVNGRTLDRSTTLPCARIQFEK